MARENDVAEYTDAIKENALYLMKQRVSQSQIENSLKQKLVMLAMGARTDQILVDIASCMIVYQLGNKKNRD